MLAVSCVALLIATALGAPQETAQQPLQAFLLSGSGAQVPAGAQIIYLQGAAQQYAAPAQGAQIAYVLGAPQTQQYQISSVQPSQQYSSIQFTQPQQHISTIKYSQPQEQISTIKYSQPQQHISTIQYTQPKPQAHVQYQPPQVHTKVFSQPAPAPVAAPKPLTKEYHVHESQVPQWAIIRSNLDDNFDGNFQYDFETENGIALAAAGSVKQLSPQEQAQVITGSYSYTAPDGRLITTHYTADENGFLAQGDHLPVAPQEPELPPLIAKSLAYIRSLPPQPENQQ